MPYFLDAKRRLGLEPDHACIFIVDVWYGHLSPVFRDWLKATYSWVHLLYVPANCTSVAQPMDGGTIAWLKASMRRLIGNRITRTLESQLAAGMKPHEIKVDLGSVTLKADLARMLALSIKAIPSELILGTWRNIGRDFDGMANGLLGAWDVEVQRAAVRRGVVALFAGCPSKEKAREAEAAAMAPPDGGGVIADDSSEEDGDPYNDRPEEEEEEDEDVTPLAPLAEVCGTAWRISTSTPLLDRTFVGQRVAMRFGDGWVTGETVQFYNPPAEGLYNYDVQWDDEEDGTLYPHKLSVESLDKTGGEVGAAVGAWAVLEKSSTPAGRREGTRSRAAAKRAALAATGTDGAV